MPHPLRHATKTSDDIAFERKLIRIIAVACCACGMVWSAIYWAVFGFGVTMALPIIFVIVVGSSIVLSYRRGDYKPLVYAQLSCITWVPTLMQWSIGSTVESGLLVLWSFLAPIGALIFLSLRQAWGWLGLFLVIASSSAIFEPALGQPLPVPDGARALFLMMNICVALSVVFAAAAWFVRTINWERRRSELLVENTLPTSIARRLKDGELMIADAYQQVTVIFADIAGFSAYSITVSPATLGHQQNLVDFVGALLLASWVAKLAKAFDSRQRCERSL